MAGDTATYPFHYAEEGHVAAGPSALFAYLDEQAQLSAHMTRRSWMMGGGRMQISSDEGGFRRLGSRLRLSGRAFGLAVFLEEEITDYRAPAAKTWRTVGTPRLLIIGSYRMGFTIHPDAEGSRLRVFLDYELPAGWQKLLGRLLGPFYARWCVHSMIKEGDRRFPAKR